MAKALDWDAENRKRRAREHGRVKAQPEVKGVSYPRPAEPPKHMLKAARGKTKPASEIVEVEGKRYRTVSLDSAPPSARQRALKAAREAGKLKTQGWVTRSGRKKKRKRKG